MVCYEIKKNPYHINHRAQANHDEFMATKFEQHCQQYDMQENPEQAAQMVNEETTDGKAKFNQMHVMNFGVKKAGMTDANDEKLSNIMASKNTANDKYFCKQKAKI